MAAPLVPERAEAEDIMLCSTVPGTDAVAGAVTGSVKIEVLSTTPVLLISIVVGGWDTGVVIRVSWIVLKACLR